MNTSVEKIYTKKGVVRKVTKGEEVVYFDDKRDRLKSAPKESDLEPDFDLSDIPKAPKEVKTKKDA